MAPLDGVLNNVKAQPTIKRRANVLLSGLTWLIVMVKFHPAQAQKLADQIKIKTKEITRTVVDNAPYGREETPALVHFRIIKNGEKA